jgi:hypothetical protein
MMIAVLYLNSQCEHYTLLVICHKYQFVYLPDVLTCHICVWWGFHIWIFCPCFLWVFLITEDHCSLSVSEETDNNWDFAISRLTYWMRSAYVIKIEINTRLIFTDLEDNRVSINGLDNVTITVSWNSDIVESQTCSSTVLFLFFNPFLDFVQLVL